MKFDTDLHRYPLALQRGHPLQTEKLNILLENKDAKFLCLMFSGLNDMFSAVNYYLNFYIENDLNLKNFYFASIYRDLNKIFDIHGITYINEKPNIKDYDVINRCGAGEPIFLNIGTQKHVSNFIQLKPKYKRYIKDYSDRIGIHVRFIRTEVYGWKEKPGVVFDNEMNSFCQKIYNLIEKNQKYVIFSDCHLIKHQLETRFGKMENIIFDLPKQSLNCLHKEQHTNQMDLRRIYTFRTIISLCSMSTCQRIYKSKPGHFSYATKMFNPNLEIVDL